MSFGRRSQETNIVWPFRSLASAAARRNFARRRPIFAVAEFIGFLFLATLWNWAIGPYYPKLRIRSAQPLVGVVDSSPAPVGVSAFMSGAMQKAVSENFGRSLPVFNISVRAKNQFLYSLFHESGASGTIVGKNEQLFQQSSIDYFCSSGTSRGEAEVNEWAGKIRAIQDILDAKGKSFIYLITPTKAATYPQFLPAHLHCPAQNAAQSNKLNRLRAVLSAHGVRYVDGPAIVAEAKSKYPIDLFARGGTHWKSYQRRLSGAGDHARFTEFANASL